jgi:hypothetical protein
VATDAVGYRGQYALVFEFQPDGVATPQKSSFRSRGPVSEA